MDLYGPYYAAVMLAAATAAAVLVSAVRGNRDGNPLAGVPVLGFGVLAAGAPAFYGFLMNDADPDPFGLFLGGLAGFGIGAVAGLGLVVGLFGYRARRD